MAPFIVLLVVTGLTRLIGVLGVVLLDSWSVAAAIGLSAMFLMTGLTHFVQPRRDGLIAIVPPGFPRAGMLVTVTGFLQLIGAVGLLVPATRGLSAACLGLLLLAMFPANVYAAGEVRHPAAPTTPILTRSGYQLVFLAACATVILAGFLS